VLLPRDPLTVPAIPGGEPPCYQQAPWTFEGKTADYPQLKPAPQLRPLSYQLGRHEAALKSRRRQADEITL
jgi:hypothetical protein